MTGKIKILFLAANPVDSSRLRLDKELREIEQRIQGGTERNRFELISQWAVTPDDLQQALLRHQPHIVHFSGHGSSRQGIILEDKFGNSQPMSKPALVDLFKILKDNIRIIVLNACYGAKQAEGLAEVIDYTIGVNTAIADESAVSFATTFYQALAFGRSVTEAFDLANNRLKADRIADSKLPELLVRKGVNDSEPFLTELPPELSGQKRAKPSTKIHAKKSTIVLGKGNKVVRESRKKIVNKRALLLTVNIIIIAAFLFLIFYFKPMLAPDSRTVQEVQNASPPRTGKLPGNSTAFSIDANYDPSGKMGDLGDITVEKAAGAVRFTYETQGKGPHEWDYTYVGHQLNPQPAQFAGVAYLDPPNNWGTDARGGFDLRGYQVIRWEARSLTDEVEVEFVIGGINWKWDDLKKERVEAPYSDSLRRQTLGIRTLISQWQNFEFDLSSIHIPEEEFACVVGAFSCVISWGSNGVKPNATGTGPEHPKTMAFEVRNIRYER